MSVAACAEIVRRGDPDRFLAAMAAPVAARAALFPIYAFNLEVARAPWLTAEPMIAEMRLQWWRDALDEIAGAGSVRRHEVATPLAEALDADGARLLDDVVAARRADIAREPFADEAALLDYLEATGGTLMWAAARACGATTGEADIRAVGTAGALANWLLAAPDLAARGWPPLPSEDPETLSRLARTGRETLAAAAAVPRVARPATLAAWQADGILARAARAPDRIGEGRLRPSEFSRRFGLLARSLGI